MKINTDMHPSTGGYDTPSQGTHTLESKRNLETP